MDNTSFPRWSAPLIGPIVGASIAAAAGREAGPAGWLGALACGAALGLAAGVLIWINDAPRYKPPRPYDPMRFDPEAVPEKGRYESHFLWIFAVLSVLLFCMPAIGLLTGIIAFAINYRYGGAALFVSTVGLMLSLLLTGAMIVVQVNQLIAGR